MHSHGEDADSSPALREGLSTARGLVNQPAPWSGVLDLPVYDRALGGFSMQSRRQTVFAALPAPVPLPLRDQEVAGKQKLQQRKKLRNTILWLVGILTIILLVSGTPLFVLSAGGWVWYFFSSRTSLRELEGASTQPITVGHGKLVHDFEIRVVWQARLQIAAILSSRAWKSEELSGRVAKLDLAETLRVLTEKALQLHQFSATAMPKPVNAQPELVTRWEQEQARINQARAGLLEQLAGIIVYRGQTDRVSALLNQRDQMNHLASRAAALDQIVEDNKPVPGAPPLLSGTGDRRELEDNLTAQIQYLGEIADGSGTDPRIFDAIHGR